MNLKRLLFIILYLLSLSAFLQAQDKAKGRFGKVTPADFTLLHSSIVDSSINAVILTDAGSTHFVGNKLGWFSYVFKKHIRLKIINKKAIEELATVRLYQYAKDEQEEKIDNVSASTYNLENGNVVETRLNKNDVFEDRIDKNHTEKKFTLPGVTEGSIIEYSYTLTSDFYINMPSWEFQSRNFPCLWSDYEVVIPTSLFYVMIKQGIHDYFIDKGDVGVESYMVTQKREMGVGTTEDHLTVSAGTIKHHWVMKDIPAFHVENYISSPYNYIDKIEFQLSKTYSGEGGKEEHKFMNTWTDAIKEMLERDDFGKPISEDNGYWLDKVLDEIVGNISGQLDRARAIYYYVNSHFTCTNTVNRSITTRLKDVLQKRSGTVGDLNLLLVAMLRRAVISADPILLNTRENGFNVDSYPVLDRLNYVIVRVKIDNQVYYLDAAHPRLGFGQLADDCYNGKAHIISATDSGVVNLSADSLNDKKTTLVLIVNSDSGGIEGNYQSTLNYPGSYDLRERVSETGEKGFFKRIQTAYGEDIQISNTGIDSLDKLEMPVKVYYDFRLNQAPGSDLYYFNPIFAEAYRTNPFTALERKYPVEMPHTLDHTYILNMDIPRGYTVDELPKSTKVALNGDEGLFEYLISSDGAQIQLRARLKLNRATFTPEDYSSLRDFYGYIVKKESEQIVLKKK